MSTVKHGEREHSIYSPSSFERWSKCPGSAQLTADLPRVDTPHSLRGTWMHEQVEHLLLGEPMELESEWATEDNLDKIHDVAAAAKEIIEDNWGLDAPIVLMEEQLDLGPYDKVADGVFGTGDLVIYNADLKKLIVVDYKFGHNIVSPTWNGQLLLYAIGAACRLYDAGNQIELVDLVILQPEGPGIASTSSLDWSDVVTWWHDTARPAIIAAKAENAPLIPGQEQCRWCPLNGNCEAQREHVAGVLATVEDAPSLPMAAPELDLPATLALLPEIEQWIAGVRAHAIDRLTKGQPVPGYKLVEGRTHRAWVDEDKADRWMAARGLSKPERTETKLLSVAQAEKKLKAVMADNVRLQNAFAKLVTKPPGKPTLAMEGDKRPAISHQDPFINEEDTI